MKIHWSSIEIMRVVFWSILVTGWVLRLSTISIATGLGLVVWLWWSTFSSCFLFKIFTVQFFPCSYRTLFKDHWSHLSKLDRCFLKFLAATGLLWHVQVSLSLFIAWKNVPNACWIPRNITLLKNPAILFSLKEIDRKMIAPNYIVVTFASSFTFLPSIALLCPVLALSFSRL